MLAGSVQANDLLPVADFDPEPDRSWFYHAENIVFSSDSYDPDGGGITGYWWYIKIGGATYWTYKYGGTSATEYAACFELDQTGTTSNGCIGLGSATTVSIWLKVRDNEYNYSNHQVTYTIKEHKGRKYFVKDHLGSVRTTVNRDGNVLGYDDYYPFGLAMPDRSNNTANPNDDYKFTGHERDEEADLMLDYMMARNYDPIIGRFLQIDPLAHEYPGLSPYNYVNNNPLNFIDPDGRYYVDADGNRVETTLNDDGQIVLSENASSDLQRMARLINESGSSTAISQFVAVGNNETKVNFKISQEIVETESGGVLLGLHQAHDAEGNALDWDSKTGTFAGDVAFTTDSDGNLIYREATITIFERTIGLLSNDKNTEMVVTNAHENEHNLNTLDIKSIKDRSEGKDNIRNVEEAAYQVGEKVRKEIKQK